MTTDNDDELPVAINYSGGSSSEWAVDAIIAGEIPRPTHVAVFFSDTRDEHAWTYEAVAQTEERCKAAGIPFVRTETHRGHGVFEAVEAATRGERLGTGWTTPDRLDTPPFWTENQGGGRGQLKQQCTQIWKTRALRKAQSEWLEMIGMPKRIRSWIGFGLDEQSRALKALNNNDTQWTRLDFPAIRLGRSRGQQRADVERWTGRPAPRFSMCRRCPYKSPERWFQTSEDDQKVAIDTDEKIRHGLEKVGIEDPCYLTDRLIPLERLIKRGDPQPALPGFEPQCFSGNCFL